MGMGDFQRYERNRNLTESPLLFVYFKDTERPFSICEGCKQRLI